VDLDDIEDLQWRSSMVEGMIPEIETERLRLRRLTTADPADLAERFFADPEVLVTHVRKVGCAGG
jgi:hypothetical protein